MQIYDIHETSSEARGEALGVLSRQTIKEFLQDGLAQINLIRTHPLPREKALAHALRYFDCLQHHLPLLAAEIAGLAKGADISLAEAMLLQCRRELIGWDEDCTLLAFHSPEQGAVIAQTIDLSGHLAEHVGAVCYRHATRDGGDLLTWNYSGLLGYLGINAHGLAIGINMVLAANWQIGIPPYLLVRHLLTLSTLDECLQEIARLPRASSRSLVLAQGEQLINLEMTVDQHRYLHGSMLVHSNHYLHTDFQPLDLLQKTSSSRTRQDRISELAASHSQLHPAVLRKILADHKELPGSICFHHDDITRGHTVSAAILLPGQRRMEVSFGAPCSAPFVNLALDEGSNAIL
ncbi:MAG: C45 family autoproteolytic acyltransferase/hydrolase [Rhizonema sp. PD38]|nr:C45 family autoproteolytic acyltransferase/hydrolase [Rhizonema sp. PD38]